MEPEEAELPELTAGAEFDEEPTLRFDGSPPNDIVYTRASSASTPWPSSSTFLDAFSPAKLPDGEKVSPPDGLPSVEGDFNPKVVPPKSDAPTALVSEVLVRGRGDAVEEGQTIAVNYRGVLWRDGKQFDTTWRQEGPAPLGFHLGSDQIIKGWNEGLRGKTVGSRMLLVVPPEMGYGSKGNADAGINGTDTLVFVVDILGAY